MQPVWGNFFVKSLLYLFFHSHNTQNYGRVKGKCRSLQELNSCCCSHIVTFLTYILLKEKIETVKRRCCKSGKLLAIALFGKRYFWKCIFYLKLCGLSIDSAFSALEFQELKFYFSTSLIMPTERLSTSVSAVPPETK